MKYIKLLSSTSLLLFFTSCASPTESIAKLGRDYNKCVVKKSTFLSEEERTKNEIDIDANYEASIVKSKRALKECSKEELEYTEKLMKCLLGKCNNAKTLTEETDMRGDKSAKETTEWFKDCDDKTVTISVKCRKWL